MKSSGSQNVVPNTSLDGDAFVLCWLFHVEREVKPVDVHELAVICRFCTPRSINSVYLFVWDIQGDLHLSQDVYLIGQVDTFPMFWVLQILPIYRNN
eukprot:2505851-Pleurochrysis_carterae.AAC.1